MIPDGAAALISFLLLTAPGIVWTLWRGRFQPGVKETTLTEVSRIVLVSLVATLLAAVIICAWTWIPLYRIHTESVPEELGSFKYSVRLAVSIAATSGVACLLALGVAAFHWHGTAPIAPIRAWSRAFVDWNRGGRDTPPFLTIELTNETVWKGSLAGFDSGPEDDQRTIALQQPLRRRRAGASRFSALDAGVVLIPESQIVSIQVSYPSQGAGSLPVPETSGITDALQDGSPVSPLT